MKPTFANAMLLLAVIYLGSSLLAAVADDPAQRKPQSFRRVLEIEIDKSSDFVRSESYDKLSDDGRILFDEMQLRMGLLLKSVVEFENSPASK